MKKLIAMLLVLIMSLPACATAGSLYMAQKYVFSIAPANFTPVEFDIIGTIVDISYTSNKHMQLLVTVVDDDAWIGITSDYGLPCCIATMPFSCEFDPPFSVGDQIAFTGCLNEFYSTVMVPDFTVREINEEDIEDWFVKYAWGDD